MKHSSTNARGPLVAERAIDWGEVLAHMPDGLVFADERVRVVFANRAAERMLGRAPGELLGQPLGDAIDMQLLVAAMKRMGNPVPIRTTGKRGDGTLVSLEVSIAEHVMPWGAVTSAVLRDLSASDRSVSTEALAAERESFLSMAAHQLRAPIQPILNSLRTIEKAMATGKNPPSDTMSRAMRQALRLGRLVDAILSDAAAIERGSLEVHVARFDLASFTRDIVEDFRLASPGHPIDYEGPTDGVMVVSDQDRTHQILIGLIDNALKYSGRQNAVKIAVCSLDGSARVQVIDTGIGIPAAEQARVFGKFYRGSNAPVAASGLGVGLFLARGIAQRLHGSLTVESEVGQGSAFSFVLPKEWPERTFKGDRGALAARLGNGKNVRSPS